MVLAWILPMTAAAEEVKGPAPKPPITTKLIDDKLVIQGNSCLGDSCANNDASYSALKIKSVQPNILFDGIELPEGGGGSPHDWALFVNYLADRFSIVDFSNGLIPFSVAAGAPDNSLYVAGNGRVGIGTAGPSNHLHVFGSTGTNKVLVQETNGTTTPRELLEIQNNGGSVMILEDTSVAQRWAAGTFGANFLLDEQAHAGIEFTLTNTGNLTISGFLTQGSSRDLKTNFISLDPKDVLARVSALPVSLWSYKDANAVRHVGPMAEDFHQAFGLGEDDKHIAPGDQAGVALLAVQGLNQRIEEKSQEIEALRHKNADLEARIATLEALLSASKPQE